MAARGSAAAAGEIVLVGLPFCAFKLLVGAVLIARASAAWGLVALGGIDLILNVINLAALPLRHRRVIPVCLTDVAVQRLGLGAGRADLGLALDTLLSFGLVAIAIGFGLLGDMEPWARATWNVAVVLNVLGAGVGRVLTALRRPTGPTGDP